MHVPDPTWPKRRLPVALAPWRKGPKVCPENHLTMSKKRNHIWMIWVIETAFDCDASFPPSANSGTVARTEAHSCPVQDIWPLYASWHMPTVRWTRLKPRAAKQLQSSAQNLTISAYLSTVRLQSVYWAIQRSASRDGCDFCTVNLPRSIFIAACTAEV